MTELTKEPDSPEVALLKSFSNRWLIVQKSILGYSSQEGNTKGNAIGRLKKYYDVNIKAVYGERSEAYIAAQKVVDEDIKWVSIYFGKDKILIDDIRLVMQEAFGIKGQVIDHVTIPNPAAEVSTPATVKKDDFSEEEIKLFISLMAAISIRDLSIERDASISPSLLRRLQFGELRVSHDQAKRFIDYMRTNFGKFFIEEDTPF